MSRLPRAEVRARRPDGSGPFRLPQDRPRGCRRLLAPELRTAGPGPRGPGNFGSGASGSVFGGFPRPDQRTSNLEGFATNLLVRGGAFLARAEEPLIAAKGGTRGAATGTVRTGPVETLSPPSKPSAEGKEVQRKPATLFRTRPPTGATPIPAGEIAGSISASNSASDLDQDGVKTLG